MLSVDKLALRYGPKQVLADISFQVGKGELLAILGPNGSGKSSLMSCLAGLRRPQQGKVELAGQDLARLDRAACARLVGYVPQRLEPSHLTVFDAVLLGRIPHRLWGSTGKDLVMVEAILHHLALDHLALRHLDQLSGGELQKVVLARSLVQEPQLLLLDEPTSALDMKNQEEVLALVRQVVEGHGLTVVVILHDLNVALRLADRLLFLKQGQLQAICHPRQLQASLVSEVYGLPVATHQLGEERLVVPVSAARQPGPAAGAGC